MSSKLLTPHRSLHDPNVIEVRIRKIYDGILDCRYPGVVGKARGAVQSRRSLSAKCGVKAESLSLSDTAISTLPSLIPMPDCFSTSSHSESHPTYHQHLRLKSILHTLCSIVSRFAIALIRIY